MAKQKTWLVDTIRRNMPRREDLESNRLVRPIAHLVLRPALWRFTRRSVPRGAAVGMAVGIIMLIPFTQFVAAALLCLPCRGNIPVAVAMTLLTNPVTTPLLIVGSLWVGGRLFGLPAEPSTVMRMIREHAAIAEWWSWLWSSAAPALIAGLLVIGVVAAIVTYIVVDVGWRLWIRRKWRARGHGPIPELT
ncbi:hypothetical protein GGR88_000691 [Sphingomonas jejuensis]|uniref:DUF2062 domain-containing protein n=1 Tax=Sphingomonas jejuensis TaxID=904715 RepID=A0ABX0XK28_9SPHN|nr:hypothetical protein [Sphingomonas jejuensis]